MELDIIKSQTTWNDAVGGINSNFAKIKAAFATVGTGGGGGLNEDELRLFLEQNGYTTENWVKLQKYLTAESADLFFARKEWVEQQIEGIDLSPYAKSTDVANTYATISALNTLEGKHNILRDEFNALSNLLSSDTTDYINTWNEVVAFLDGYKDESDLATILSGMNADISSRLLASDFESWKTNVFTPTANLVANHTTRLDGLDQSILSINTRIDGVDKTIEDHIAEFIAFRANFEISDDLILVRKNFASTEEVSAKGINQGTGGGGGSSYSRLDTWEGYDSNKAGYVLSAGLGYGLKVAIDELNGYDLDNRVRSIENSYVSKDAGGVVNGGLVVSSLAVAGGSSSQFLKADGSLDGTSYLPTSGGVIRSDRTTPLEIFTTNTVEVGISLVMNNAYKGWVGYNPTYGTILYNYASNAYLGIRDDGVATLNHNALIHLGNVGEYAGIYLSSATIDLNEIRYGFRAGKLYNSSNAANAPAAYRGFLEYGTAGFVAQFNSDDQNNLFYRWCENGTWLPWKTIAFTDSDITGNAGGLHYKDASLGNYYFTPYDYGFSLEGQYATLRLKGTNIYNCQVTFADNNDVTRWSLSYRGANNADKDFYLGKLSEDGAYTPLIALNYSSENVLIGTTTDNGSGAKLQVENANNVALSLKCTTYSETSIRYEGSDGKVWTAGKGIMSHGDSFGFYSVTAGRDIVRFTTEGAIINGTLNAGATSLSSLYVSSDIVTDRIIIGGVTLSTEDGVLKIESDMYATGEISAHGLNKGESGGGGSSYSRLDTWIGYDSSKAGYVLSAGLGYDLKLAVDELNGYNLNSRLTTVESNYLGKNGGTINGSLTIGDTDNASWMPINFNRSGYQGFIGSEGSAMAMGTNDGYIRVGKDILTFVNNGSGNPILHSGNIVDYALSTSGGTINGKLTLKPQGYHAIDIVSPDNALAQITISTNDTLRGIVQYNLNFGFGFSHDGRGGIYVAADGTPTYVDSSLAKFPLIHEGNCDMYSLSVWGGTLKGNLTLSESYLKITAYGKEYGYNVNAGNGEPIYLKDDTWRTIIHSGNIGSQSVNHALFTNFMMLSKSDLPANTRGDLDYSHALYTGGWASSSLGYASAYGTFIDISGYSTWYHRLAFNTSGEIEHFQGINTTTLSKVGSLAYLTSNVASATKLETPRTIWGQSFDGTGNVGGSLHLDRSDIYWHYDKNNFCIESVPHEDKSPSLKIAHYGGIELCTLGTERMRIANNGNVGIGTTDPQYKFHVEGAGYFSGALTANGILTVGGASIHPTANNPYFQLYQNNNYWYWQSENDYMYIGGTVSKAMCLDQDGNAMIVGTLSAGATTLSSLGVNGALTIGGTTTANTIKIKAGQSIQFEDNNGVVHTLKYDSTKQAFVFDGNVNASGEISAHKINA